MWCRNVAAGLASLRRPARARAATSIPPRSPMASKRPRKGPETKTMQNSPCRDHATTLRRPCDTLQSPLQKPCSTPGGGGGPEKKRLPGNPEKPSRRRGPLPQQEAKAQAPSRWLASKKRANCIWRSSINQEPLRSGRPSLRTPLSPPCFKILFTSGTETHMFFFHPNRRTRKNPEGPRPRSSRPAIAASEGCGRQRATACTSSRRHRRRFRRRGRRRRRSPSILSSHPLIII